MSDNNTEGLQGVQGTSSIQGLQGITGPRGVQGYQGFRGIQGIQGLQGKPGLSGYKGLQGVRGTQGTTGDNGTNGVQGMQGKPGMQGTRGCQGINGLRGTQGVQGLQGKKGLRGAIGYMGYIGDTGEVGIQGLQGKTGYAVYFDGIRMNGYNSNLFIYDAFAYKFVSVNRNVPDILKIDNGTVIKIWLNSSAFSRLVECNTITIDNVVNGQVLGTDYPAYYNDNQNISELLTNTSSTNCVVEFTFNDGAWHYSGGILGTGGGSGAAPIFTRSFEVMGMNLGEMTDGTHVNAGEKIENVVRKMLTNVVDVTYVAPKLSSSTSVTVKNEYEVGSMVAFNINSSLIDGYFESSNKEVYSDETFNQINNTQGGKLNAGCSVDTITYKLNGETLANNSVFIASIGDTECNYSTNITYTGSSVTAKKNNGENSTVSIAPGTTASQGKTFRGKYKAFWGYTQKILSSDERPYANVFTTKESLSALNNLFINPTGEMTVASTLKSTAEKSSIVLVIPDGVTITNLSNSLNMPLDDPYDKLRFQNTIQYTNGNITTTYNVYVLHSLDVAEYKNLKIRK